MKKDKDDKVNKDKVSYPDDFLEWLDNELCYYMGHEDLDKYEIKRAKNIVKGIKMFFNDVGLRGSFCFFDVKRVRKRKRRRSAVKMVTIIQAEEGDDFQAYSRKMPDGTFKKVKAGERIGVEKNGKLILDKSIYFD